MMGIWWPWGDEPKDKVEFTGPRIDDDIGIKRLYANQLLNNPIFMEVINKLETECIEMWKSTTPEDVSKREILYIHQKVLKQLVSKIKQYIAEAENKAAQHRNRNMTAVK
jgi:hypothetical protein